ncbi:MAG: HAD family hydrolase [Candidatus Liptonbacteria bacterium]|nr:HAD family hydrolase [Candidatus Liptonbacteria bacterium]
MIRSVIFDIDGVLIDSLGANLKFFQDLMQYAGHPLPTREEFGNFFHLTLRDAVRAMTGLTDEKAIRKIVTAGRDRTVPYPIPLLKYPEQLEEVIRELGGKYLLGIATSRGRTGVYEPPKLAALREYFKVSIAYEDTQHHKPHPAPLLLAAERLQVKPEECVYVGDAETDMLAARAAGMKVIIYSQSEIGGADRITARFRDIPELVGEL